MKLRLIAAAVAALALTAGNAVAQDTSTEKGKLSYALGYDLGRNAIESGEQVDVNTIIKGLQDGYGKKQPAVPVEQLRTAVQNMQQRQQTKAKAAWDKAAAENKTKSDTFLTQNKAKAGVKSLPSGVQYRVVENGTGAKPTQTNTVQLEVAGPYAWGERPQQARPAQNIQAIKVSEIEMPAMREALLQMPAGSK
ncbi:MAG TPA: FKBP-type peptidyl-prolyl cis-trans isomerase N-terminal domain-containing protein, partial [Lysobacter sp.]